MLVLGYNLLESALYISNVRITPFGWILTSSFRPCSAGLGIRLT